MYVVERRQQSGIRTAGRYLLLSVLAFVLGCSADPESEKVTPQAATITASEDGSLPDSAPPAYIAENRAVSGNNVELLLDGPETYAKMFRSIAAARDHINLETFILMDDVIGLKLADALIERAQNGVVVNVIYDAIGSMSADAAFFENLSAQGISLLAFRPLLDTEPADWINRNHRKILVVDGRIGYTGGLNFTKEYRSAPKLGDRESDFAEGWRDTHLKIEGPAVEVLQREFLRVWHDFNDEQPLANANYFPGASKKGSHAVVIATAVGDGEQSSSIIEYYLQAMGAAYSRIWITQAYFSPTDEFIESLKNAAQRGVDVRLLLPGESDVKLAELAARAYYGELLEAGVRIYQFAEGVLHAKTALVDYQWSTVGSSNLDLLSIEYNNELNAIVLDQQFTHQLAETFQLDLQRADEVTIDDWNNRSIWAKAKHAFAKLLQVGM